GTGMLERLTRRSERMRDLAFYNAGCLELRGLQRLTVPFRRLVRYLLRPIFQRQVELFQALHDDIVTVAQSDRALTEQVAGLVPWLSELQAELSETQAELREIQTHLHDVRTELNQAREEARSTRQSDRLAGLEDDHLAVARRLAALEDGVEFLRNLRDGTD